MVHYFIPLADERGVCTVQVKLLYPLRTRAIPERLRGVFTTSQRGAIQIHVYLPTVQQHKHEYQQNIVKHSDGLPEKHIANLSSSHIPYLSEQIRVTICGSTRFIRW